MITLSFNQTNAYFSNARAPQASFAARLTGLQARQEQATHHVDIAGVVARGILAWVPFLGLAWVFVAL